MAMPKVVEANVRHPCLLKDFGKGVANYTRVKWFAADITEEYQVAIV